MLVGLNCFLLLACLVRADEEALPKPVNFIAFSPDGKTFASAHVDGVTRVWDAITGKIRHELKGHKMSVADVAYSPNGHFIASVSWRHTYKGAIRELKRGTHHILIWGSETGGLQGSVPLRIDDEAVPFSSRNRGALSVEFLPDNSRLITTGHSDVGTWLQGVWVWNRTPNRLSTELSPPLAPGERPRREGGAVTLAVSSNGQFVATAGTYFFTNSRRSFKDILAGRGNALSMTIRLWNLKDIKIANEQDVEMRCNYVPYDGSGFPSKPQSGIPLFASDGKQLFLVLHSGEVAILETPSLKEVRRIEFGDEPAQNAALTAALLPKNRLLVAHATTSYVVDLGSGEAKPIQFEGVDSPITALAISPSSDPQHIAVGCLDGTLGLWNLATRKKVVNTTK